MEPNMELDQLRKEVSQINWEISRLGMETVDPNTGKQMMQYWLPDKLKQLLIEEADRPDEEKEHIAIVKFFDPTGAGTWWVSEYHDRGDEHIADFFGACRLLFPDPSLGYVNLKELRDTRVRFGLWVERDYHFTPTPLSECK